MSTTEFHKSTKSADFGLKVRILMQFRTTFAVEYLNVKYLYSAKRNLMTYLLRFCYHMADSKSYDSRNGFPDIDIFVNVDSVMYIDFPRISYAYIISGVFRSAVNVFFLRKTIILSTIVAQDLRFFEVYWGFLVHYLISTNFYRSRKDKRQKSTSAEFELGT